jgi:hypothetical protein
MEKRKGEKRMKIEELYFSTRVYNCLKRKGINTVEQLAAVTERELMGIRSFGVECLKEVREKIAVYKEHVPEKQLPEIVADAVADPMPIVTEREQQTVRLPEELIRAVEILKEEYEKTKNNPYIYNPIAWALYHAWKRIDSRR